VRPPLKELVLCPALERPLLDPQGARELGFGFEGACRRAVRAAEEDASGGWPDRELLALIGCRFASVKQRDIVALVVIWSLVLTGAFLLAALGADDDPQTDDAAGAGVLAAIAGAILTGLYFFVLELRSRKERVREPTRTTTSHTISTATPSGRARWVEIVLVTGLWIAGTVVALIAGVPVDYAAWLGGLLPLAVLLVRHLRRSDRRH
jgi:hypothetical protein